MKTFVNPDIFPSDGDYIIGGFSTDKVDGFNVADFAAAFKSRIHRLCSDYLKRAIISNQSMGYDDPIEQANQDLALIIHDNLGFSVLFNELDVMVEAIYQSDKAQAWMLGIRKNVQDISLPVASKYKGIYNHSVEIPADSDAYENAVSFTEEITLEQFIEQLSMVEM